MKTKILSLVLVLSIVLTLGLFATPVSAATTGAEVAPAGTASVEAEVAYDEAYVSSTTGSDSIGNGTVGNPWRTITHAVNMLPYKGDPSPNLDPPGSTLAKLDRINVMASGPVWYGFNNNGGTIAENIVVTKPVVIRANPPADRTNTKVDVTSQGINQVIEVKSSNVTIDGLFLTGAPVGVWAHGADAAHPIDNVQVLNCQIKIDEVEDGTGIEMEYVKYEVIDNNIITVGTEGGQLTLSVDDAIGILEVGCFQSTITNNNIDVHGGLKAHGIVMDTCPKCTVANNDIDVLAAGDTIGVGIEISNSPLIQVTDNEVTVETNGNTFSLAFGIKVCSSDRSNVLRNVVTVNNNGVSNVFGFMEAIGIRLKTSNESHVDDNTVAVTGVGIYNSNAFLEIPEALTDDDTAEDLADVDSILSTTLGNTLSLTLGAGVVIGIKVSHGDLDTVNNNGVDVQLAESFVSADQGIAVGGGAGVAIGIIGCDAGRLQVQNNTVSVDKALPDWAPDLDTMLYIKVWSTDNATGDSNAFGGGLVVALGIVLFDCDLGMVADNSVIANATMELDIKAVPKPGDLETGSALARVNSELLNAIYQSFNDAIQSEQVNAKISGTLPSIESFGLDGGIAAGFGILVVDSYGASITGNDPVVGTADVTGNTWSKESNDAQEAEAFAGALSLGLGIGVIDSMSANVANNLGVNGTGTATLQVGALHDPPILIQEAEAFGGGAGIGIGILVCGLAQYQADAGEVTGDALNALEAAPQSGFWPGRTEVVNNVVTAAGEAEVCVCAEDQIPDHPAIAVGKGLGVAIGIAAVFEPCILIEGNMVTADGEAVVCVGAKAIDSFDPLSMGGAAGIGIGIASVASWRSQIVGNMSTGEGTAEGFVLAIETPFYTSPALGFGGSIGLGKGILVFGSGASLVKGNSVANGLGDAKTKVAAINEVPLDGSFALSLAAGIGNGIAVVCSPCTEVIECNTAAGVGTARVCAWSDSDFNYAFKLGVAVSIDILMILPPHTNSVSEADFDAQGGGPHFGRVNYNSMVDVDPLGTNSSRVIVFDAGLLKIGWPRLDAQFNWWNDPTGPTGFGPGTGDGEAVYWVGKAVDFTPWLYVVHTEVLDEQIGKFGFFIKLCKGLNAISTPIALEQTVVPSRTWADVLANSGLTDGYKFILRWTGSGWDSLDAPELATTYLDPLEAFYIYLYDDSCMNLILMVNSDDGHPYAMPTRNLSAGWNLIGPNPIFPDDDIPADDALSSIEQTPAGLPGYTQVISPVVRCQPAWYYVPGNYCAPDMESGRGYWVWMENADKLVGFGFSPLPDQLSQIH